MNNKILESFKACGWEFKDYSDPIPEAFNDIVFKSPRMDSFSYLCDVGELDELTEAQIKEREIDYILERWKSELENQIRENVIAKMAGQYKILMMKDINPPRSQKISFDVEFKL